MIGAGGPLSRVIGFVKPLYELDTISILRYMAVLIVSAQVAGL